MVDIVVSPNGDDSARGDSTANPMRSLAAARDSTSEPGRILLTDGRHDVGAGHDHRGSRLAIVGTGAGHTNREADRCVLYAPNQAGPVLNLDGAWTAGSFLGKVTFGGFAVEGSGQPTPGNDGIRVATDTPNGSLVLRDVAVSGTGGPGLNIGALYLSSIYDVVVKTPSGAKANDVPYVRMAGANGNVIDRLLLRSMAGTGDVGASGALVLTSAGGYAAHENILNGLRAEYLHAPSGGCLLSVQGNMNVVRDAAFFDCSKEAGAVGTAVARFLAPTEGVNTGANRWDGHVPGRGTETTSIDYGIELRQSGNWIEGQKGYRGHCVWLWPGVQWSSVHLKGSESGAAAGPGWRNDSGSMTNYLSDETTRTVETSGLTLTTTSAGPRWSDAKGEGALLLGLAGVSIRTCVGSPEGKVSAPPPSLCLRRDAAAGPRLWMKSIGTGTTGWVAIK